MQSHIYQLSQQVVSKSRRNVRQIEYSQHPRRSSVDNHTVDDTADENYDSDEQQIRLSSYKIVTPSPTYQRPPRPNNRHCHEEKQPTAREIDRSNHDDDMPMNHEPDDRIDDLVNDSYDHDSHIDGQEYLYDNSFPPPRSSAEPLVKSYRSHALISQSTGIYGEEEGEDGNDLGPAAWQDVDTSLDDSFTLIQRFYDQPDDHDQNIDDNTDQVEIENEEDASS
jgi:hypothetical protein